MRQFKRIKDPTVGGYYDRLIGYMRSTISQIYSLQKAGADQSDSEDNSKENVATANHSEVNFKDLLDAVSRNKIPAGFRRICRHRCRSDNECSDALFCNKRGRCAERESGKTHGRICDIWRNIDLQSRYGK